MAGGSRDNGFEERSLLLDRTNTGGPYRPVDCMGECHASKYTGNDFLLPYLQYLLHGVTWRQTVVITIIKTLFRRTYHTA